MRYLNIYLIRYNWVFLYSTKSCVWLAKLLLALAYIKVRYPLATNVYIYLYLSVLVFIIFNFSLYHLMLFTLINLCSLGIVHILYINNSFKSKYPHLYRASLFLFLLTITVCVFMLIGPYILKVGGYNSGSGPHELGKSPQKGNSRGPRPPRGPHNNVPLNDEQRKRNNHSHKVSKRKRRSEDPGYRNREREYHRDWRRKKKDERTPAWVKGCNKELEQPDVNELAERQKLIQQELDAKVLAEMQKEEEEAKAQADHVNKLKRNSTFFGTILS